MSALVYLGIAVGLSLLGCLTLWLRSRQPRSMDAHIRDFARELDALAPGSPLDASARRKERNKLERPPGPGPETTTGRDRGTGPG